LSTKTTIKKTTRGRRKAEDANPPHSSKGNGKKSVKQNTEGEPLIGRSQTPENKECTSGGWPHQFACEPKNRAGKLRAAQDVKKNKKKKRKAPIE